MAPSSSSSVHVPIKGWTYDVFLSFRGEDILNNFVDHLHTALIQNGIRVLKDDEMLHRGNAISTELPKAIEGSRFAVVVFSENYANSSRCLDELAKIIECHDYRRQKVLPVFYHVDPSDVGGQKRDFATAFQQHEEKFMEETDKVNKWRKAFTAAASLSGWHISSVNGGESLFINKIVQNILDHIQPHLMEMKNSNLVGIDSHIDALKLVLDLKTTQDVRMVGIWGMGGIGKTTIARSLFGGISYEFDGCSFINNVRENSSRNTFALQEQILKDITHHQFNITHPDNGAKLIQRRFCNKKVLLVLDDVDDVKQLEFLAARHRWFGPGSRIIITTRDMHLLYCLRVHVMYECSMLSMEQSLEIFSRYAFRKNSPPEAYEEQSIRAIRYAYGVPLAVTALGSFFHGKEESEWENALNRLAKMPGIEIFEILRVCFDGLDDSEKQIFLDIACFFKGRDKEHVIRVLDSFGFYTLVGIHVLIEKSLVTFSNENKIDMHHLIHEFGLDIVQRIYPNSRLWQPEEVHDYIKKNRKLEAIEAIGCSSAYGIRRYEDMCDMGFHADVFKNMRNLRLLDISGSFTYCIPTTLPDELRWLGWYDYPFSSLPLANLRNLVGLEITFGEIQHFSTGDEVLPRLKFIDLRNSYYLKRLPDVSWAPNVERLTLSECINMVEVDESLGSLKRLVYLDMSGCKNLECLPSKIEMPSLKTLDISDCSRLEKFPEVSSGMEKLSEIRVYGCSRKLENNIPNSIRELCTSFLVPSIKEIDPHGN